MAIQFILEEKTTYTNAIYYYMGKLCNESLVRVKQNYASLLQGCLKKKSVLEAKLIHAHMILTDHCSNISLNNKIVSIYGKFGKLLDSRQMFDKMPQRNSVSWTTMIGVYARSGFCEEALKLYYEMKKTGYEPDQFTFAGVLPAFADFGDLQKGKEVHEDIIRGGYEPDVFVGSALVDMYIKCKSLGDAHEVFDRMPVRDVITWTALIGGYVELERFDEVLNLFTQMIGTGITPDAGVFAVVLPACANLPALGPGKAVHEDIVRNGFQFNPFVGSGLVHMYAKCGSIEDAHKVFDQMPKHDVVSWTAMIVGYALHGYSKEALELFDQMLRSGVKPSHVTFIGVLSACCHGGLVDAGSHYFRSMSLDYDIRPSLDHYCCMVDLLGRSGHLDKAEDCINNMPMKPNIAVWRSLLGACRMHGNVKLGEWVAEQLFYFESEHAANYVLLSNIYARAQNWDGMQNVRKMMKDNKVKKNPGCSWIELRYKVHAFLAEEI